VVLAEYGNAHERHRHGTPRLGQQLDRLGDVKLLRAMLRWATTVRVQRGARRLLETNPLECLKPEREQDPRRPVATWARFEKTARDRGTRREADKAGE